MTAAKLHSLPPHRESYEGGFTTEDEGCHFTVGKDSDDENVHFNMSMHPPGFGSVSCYKRLSRDEALELAGALEKAARA